MQISHRKQSAEEIAVWERWTKFCDEAMVPPDTIRDAQALADRYYRETGRLTTTEAVQTIMPENHPNYPWGRDSCMKRLILSLAAVAFLAAPAMAQADSGYVSPEKQAIMNAYGYSVTAHVESVPPVADKYCPGPKKSWDVGRRLRNSNGATLVRLWFDITECRGPNGDHKWHQVNHVRMATPSVYWDREWGPQTSWKRGTGWCEMLVIQRIPGSGALGDNEVWDFGLWINPQWDNGLWARKGWRIK